MAEIDIGSGLPQESIPVVSVKLGQLMIVRALGRPPFVWTHWVNGMGSRPCLKVDCPHCPKLARYQVWYLPAEHWVCDRVERRWEQSLVLVALPQRAAEALRYIEEASGRGSYVGMMLQLTRPGKVKTAPVRLELCEEQTSRPLPESFDVAQVLRRRWGLREESQPEQKPGVIRFPGKAV